MTRLVSRRGMVLGSAAAVACACLPDGSFKRRHGVVPQPLDDGWQIATPADVGLDPAALDAIHMELLREDRQRGALGMLVVKDDRLVWETYLRTDRDRDRHHHVQSTTKSITSLAFGVARDRGLFPSLDLRLRDVLPSAVARGAEDKGDITLDQLLTMRSGIAFDNDTFSLEMWVDRPADGLGHILRKPLYAQPGERFYYRDADPQVIGYVLQHVTGRSEKEWTREHLFAPLGIHDYFWESGRDGVSLAAHGLHLRARDMAKIGALMLHRGALGSGRIVSEEWVQLSTATHVSRGPLGTRSERLGYGYYWWTDDERALYSAWGHGGQHILVSPRDNLVLVKIALPDTDDLEGSSLDEFIELVAPLLASATG